MRDCTSPPLRVLVVDDCTDNRDSLALLLGLWGHEVCLARDGPSALEASRSFLPQVVLLDIGLPGMNGWQVARRLREAFAERAVRLVAMTGYGQEEDRRRSQEARIDYHLLKPVEPERLQRLLACPEAATCEPSSA